MSTGGWFDDRERRPEPERQQEFSQRLTATVQHAWKHAPGWQRRLEEAGVEPGSIKGLDDLSRIPVLRKADLPALQAEDPPFGGLLAVPLTQLQRVFMSPGPIFDPQHGTVDIGGFARGMHAGGFRDGMLVLNGFAYHLTPAGHAFESGAIALGCTVIPGGVGNTEQQAELLRIMPVSAYVGTPSFLSILLERATEWRFEAACVAAEKLTESQRAELEDRGGGTVRQLYGTADLGHLAAECTACSGMHVTEDKFIEICDPDTGEPVRDGESGEVVVTTFSETYPMLRLGTGDLSRFLTEADCSCGRTSRRLAGVLGRVGAGVKVRGMFVYPHQLAAVLRDCGISQGQLVVDREGHRDTLVVNVPGPQPEERLAEVASSFRAVAKVRAEVCVVDALTEDAPPIVDRRAMWQEGR